MTTSLRGRTVLIAGATSASGLAATRALVSAGALVIAVGRDPAKLAALAATAGVQDASPDAAGSQRVEHAEPAGARVLACDLGDEGEVARLAERVHAEAGSIDGILHLVGGWRGGGGLAGQSDDDFRFLEGSLTALRHVSRAFDADLRASDAARCAIVSSTAVARPLAGGANYAAVKAASEAWTRAVAQGFAKAARDAGEPLRAASVVFRVSALAGLEATLADAFVGLWDQDAATVNDTIVTLAAGG
ncbi:SDR family NAD(P)-dependent oxidoreductase [Microbacterium ulmi]|uniref:SDR family oxidoreductase n=1 Tax=Microbacterium ulmi TaxID=179095 RepID=A0A7Y2M369_9MICO|nr:SDR family oxidoreductase [Microbacterium ulmi]NII70058.1 NAD(P)-dependent dehydrogenase (short-subunit alcohol dehydrogenase family) [Microbacterium ulmi]NNH05194.1 SDR family oxidoreductase [Microbacterium ulmi]